MLARLGVLVVVVAVAGVGCGSAAGYGGDADTNSACAITNATDAQAATCGVPSADSGCCGLRSCPSYQEFCAGIYPYGCCDCSRLNPQQPQWEKPEFDCHREAGPEPAADAASADAPPDAASHDGPADAGAD